MALNLEAPHSAADSDVFSNSSRVNVVSLEEYIRGGVEEILLGVRRQGPLLEPRWDFCCCRKFGNIHHPLPENITLKC